MADAYRLPLMELRGQPFVILLAQEENTDKVRSRLVELVSGEREHIEEESDIRCKDQGLLNIVWQHSRLGQGDDAP